MNISQEKKYLIVLLCGFVLLFPSAAMQSAYSHPLTSDVDNLEPIEAGKLFKECEKVKVTAQISEIMLHWDGTTEEKRDSFNDGLVSSLSDGEVELLYKIWEPGHSQSPILSGLVASYNKANVASSIVEDDWKLDFSEIRNYDYYKINELVGEKEFDRKLVELMNLFPSVSSSFSRQPTKPLRILNETFDGYHLINADVLRKLEAGENGFDILEKLPALSNDLIYWKSFFTFAALNTV